MLLKKGSSREVILENVKELIKSEKPINKKS
jgi:hypothetical protein